MNLQGYAAREFAKQGVQPGELAIISKEAVRLSVFVLNYCFFEIGGIFFKQPEDFH